MANKFDPAPTDKLADTPEERSDPVKKADDELKKGTERQLRGIRSNQQHAAGEINRRQRLARRLWVSRNVRSLGTEGVWRVRHDGKAENDYATKEAAFEAAIAAASLALRRDTR